MHHRVQAGCRPGAGRVLDSHTQLDPVLNLLRKAAPHQLGFMHGEVVKLVADADRFGHEAL